MRLLAFGSLFIFCQALAVFSVHVFKSLAIIDKVQVPCPIHSGSPSRGVEVVDGINLFNNSNIAKKNSPPFNISIPIFQSCMVFPRLTKKCTVAKIFCYNNCGCIEKYWMACYLATFRLLYNNGWSNRPLQDGGLVIHYNALTLWTHSTWEIIALKKKKCKKEKISQYYEFSWKIFFFSGKSCKLYKK